MKIVFPHLAQLLNDSYDQTQDQKRYERINMPLFTETKEHHIRSKSNTLKQPKKIQAG